MIDKNIPSAQFLLCSASFESTEHFFDQLDAQSLILTANRRLSRYLRKQFDDKQRRSHGAWETLNCYPLQGWLQACWSSLQQVGWVNTEKMVLTSVQEQLIWQHIVEQQSDQQPLLNHLDIAKIAHSAWQTLIRWELQPESLGSFSADTRFFRKCCARFKYYCDARGLIDTASQEGVITHAAKQKRLDVPKTVFLIGFEDLTPIIKSMMGALSEQGTQIQQATIAHAASDIVRVSCRDGRHEVQTAARWAAKRLEIEPDANIGIICPNLSRDLSQIEHAFTEMFEPQAILPEQARHAPGFNISAAQNLSCTAPVQAALLTLRLNHRTLDLDQTSRLLGSPFLGLTRELNARALVGLDIATEQAISVSRLRAKCAELLPEQEEPRCPDFYNRLHQLHLIQLHGPESRRPSGWAQMFHAQLMAMGWPGDRRLDTIEYQQVQMWHGVIQTMAQLDYVFDQVDLMQALHYLQSLVAAQAFHPQTRESPVQILGLLEAAGIPFDYLWVMGLDNQSWPLPAKPNPLIPIDLQKKMAMPNASADRELTYAKNLTRIFKKTARSIVFSYSEFEGDQALTASPLIESVRTVLAETLEAAPSTNYSKQLFALGPVDAFVDSCGPKISHPAAVVGGTQILKDQAACGFRAFAQHRLHANKIEKPVSGLSPIERGNLIHHAMEYIWRKLKSYQQFIGLSDSQLNSLVKDAIDAAMRELAHERTLGYRLRELETQRMMQLIFSWLALEKEREPFTVVFNEKKRSLRLAKMPLKVRYDRVDRLEDGSLFVIDYKTGIQNISAWSGHRPDEPQIPIYAIGNYKKISGVAFGQINIKETAFKGIAEREETAPGLKIPEMLNKIDLPDSWQEIVTHWRMTLEILAMEFVAGTADVNPKYPGRTCQYCHLHTLCRVKEYIHVDEGDEEAEND